MVEGGHIRINNTLVCQNEVVCESTILQVTGRLNNTSVCWKNATQESLIHQYDGTRYQENQ